MQKMILMALLSVASTAHAVQVVRGRTSGEGADLPAVSAPGQSTGLVPGAVSGDRRSGTADDSFMSLAAAAAETGAGPVIPVDTAAVASTELAGSLLLLIGALALWSVTGGGRAGTPRLSS